MSGLFGVGTAALGPSRPSSRCLITHYISLSASLKGIVFNIAGLVENPNFFRAKARAVLETRGAFTGLKSRRKVAPAFLRLGLSGAASYSISRRELFQACLLRF